MSLNLVLEVKLEWLERRLELSLVCMLRVHCSAHKGEIIQVIYTMHRAVLTWCKEGLAFYLLPNWCILLNRNGQLYVDRRLFFFFGLLLSSVIDWVL